MFCYFRRSFAALTTLLREFVIYLLMSQTESKPQKKVHQQSDNCENCIRQRKQNESFIKIYQKLQAISQKTSGVKEAVQSHKSASDTTRSFFSNFQQKISQLPKNKMEVNSQLIKDVGFELAVSIVEQERRKKVMAQNQHLKRIITQMRKDKWQKEDSLDLMKSSCFTERKYPEAAAHQLDRTFNSCQAPKPAQNQTESLEKLLLSREVSEDSEPNTTRTSVFNPAPLRNSVDLSKYNDMNLWLYQPENHTKLEQELYMSNRSKNNSFAGKSARGRLSSLRAKK